MERETGSPVQNEQNHIKSDKMHPDKSRSEGRIQKQNRFANLQSIIYDFLRDHMKLSRIYVLYPRLEDVSKVIKLFRTILT